MNIRDLICTPDGALSGAKLAACTAHLLMASAFFKSQVLEPTPVFNDALWLCYAGFAIGHAGFNSTLGVVNDLTGKKLDQNTATVTTTTTASGPA